MVAPPSTAIAVPWMCRAFSEHRNSVSAETSSALPSRRKPSFTVASFFNSSTDFPDAFERCSIN
jgi:hypothetical protein